MDFGQFASQFREFPALLKWLIGLTIFLGAVCGIWVLFEWSVKPAQEGAGDLVVSGASNVQSVLQHVNVGDGSAVANGPGAIAKVVVNRYADLPPDSLWAKMGVAGAPDLGALNTKYPYGYFVFFAEENGPFQIQAGSPLREGWKLDVTGIRASFSPGKITIVVSELIDTLRHNKFTNIHFVMPRMASQSIPSTFDEIEFMAEVVALSPRGFAGVLGFRPPGHR